MSMLIMLIEYIRVDFMYARKSKAEISVEKRQELVG